MYTLKAEQKKNRELRSLHCLW